MLESAELAALAFDERERVLELALERARDEPMLGLAGVELTAGALGLVLGAFDGEPLTGEALLVRSFSSRMAPAVAPMPAGVTASRNAWATALSSRPPPSDWQARSVACRTWPRTQA